MPVKPGDRPAPLPEALQSTQGAIVVHGYNVMDPSDRAVWRAQPGSTMRDLAPVSAGPVVACVNGEWVLQDDWHLVEPVPGDIVVYRVLPTGGGGNGSLQTVIGIVLIVVGAWTTNPGLIAAGASFLVSGLLAPPSIAPITGPTSIEAPSPTYNIQLAGNAARLGQPIPVLYGRHIINPDFAAQPYQEFGLNDDQYYHALLSFGVMERFTLESIMIDDTLLSHFTDFEVQYIGPQYPGTALTLVNAAVVTAPEVAGQELVAGVPVGPFAVNGAGLRAEKLGIDVTCPKGLYFANDSGALTPKTVSFFFEARPINDSGTSGGDWFPLSGIESITLAQNSPVRRTYLYTVPAGRYEVRGQRTDTKDTNARAGHELSWAGLRGYLNPNVPLDPNANFVAIRIKANNQLSGFSQRKIALVVQRWLPTWRPDTGWSAPVATSNPAWALADVLRNTVYSTGVQDSRIDLMSLWQLSLTWETRRDEFNGVFDKRVTMWSALQTIARCGRARPIMRGSVFTFVRDDKQTLPTAKFTTRNIERGSFSVDFSFTDDDDVDGVEVSFFNSAAWAVDYARWPADSLHPAQVSIQGITNRNQALREAAYMWADIRFRPNSLVFTTELEGFLPAFGDLIAVQHDVTGWGQAGDIESFDGVQAVLTENVTWSVGNHYIMLINEQGDPKGPYLVVPGEERRSVQFIELPDPADIYTGTERERTRFAFGPGNAFAKMCKVVGISPRENTVQITAVIEDNRVHEEDPALFAPVPGSPGSGGPGAPRVARYAPDGTPAYGASSDAERMAYGFFSTPELTVGGADPGYVYAADTPT